MTAPERQEDPFAHLKQRASERADRTVERMRTGIAALQASSSPLSVSSITLNAQVRSFHQTAVTCPIWRHAMAG